MTINSTAIVLMGFLIAVAKRNKINIKDLSGTVQNDILKEYIARGTYIYPPHPSMKLVTDIFEYCNIHLPKWNTISISGYHIREAGSSAVQELAFTFSNAIEYVNAAIEQGLDINKFGQRLSFFFNSHNNFFEEIAKFRAARKIWAQIMKKRFKATNKKALLCRFHTQTAGSTLQAQSMDNNIIRTTMQATAAILGGTQSLHTNSKDEAISLPSKGAAETALRTQQILAHETGIPNVVDPLAGSYYVESLTNSIEKETLQLIQKIDDLGGSIKAIENSFQDIEITNSSYEYQKLIEKKEQIIVGVNKYQNEIDESNNNDLFQINQEDISTQLSRLKRFKKNRKNKLVEQNLNQLKDAIKKNKNLLPIIVQCVENNCTLGEICNIMRTIYGEYS